MTRVNYILPTCALGLFQVVNLQFKNLYLCTRSNSLELPLVLDLAVSLDGKHQRD
jgi:hypothetical protein